jgi:putative hydrolase of the HAD superfamily
MDILPKFDVIFIDLDETLYPKSNGLWRSISHRINQFMVERLDISIETAHELRQSYLESYGTTLNGLLQNHDIDPLDYLDFVHEIPIESMIKPDPTLRQILNQVTPARFIFTNASYQHAERVLTHLNILDLFEEIIDIITLGYANKPLPESYQKALTISGSPRPEKCMIIDDRIANLIPAKEFGMTTVLVGDGQEDAVDFCIPTIHKILEQVPGLE